MKYKILLAITSTFLFLSGCNNVDFNKSINKDVLEKTNKWYEIDSTRDIYQTFKFTDNKLIKDVYNDKDFSELIDTKSYDIDYISDDKFNIVKDGVIYTCDPNTCNKDEYVIIGCKANESGVKDLLYCGWNNKDKAKTNMQ